MKRGVGSERRIGRLAEGAEEGMIVEERGELGVGAIDVDMDGVGAASVREVVSVKRWAAPMKDVRFVGNPVHEERLVQEAVE